MEKNEFEKQLTDLFSGLKGCLRHRDIEARFFTHGMIMGALAAVCRLKNLDSETIEPLAKFDAFVFGEMSLRNAERLLDHVKTKILVKVNGGEA